MSRKKRFQQKWCHDGIVMTLPAKACGCWERVCARCEEKLSETRCSEHSEPALFAQDEIEAAKTLKGGWTRKQLAEWGIPWPPPKGWRKELELRFGLKR